MAFSIESSVVPLRWVGSREEGYLEMLDQRLLPTEEVWLAMKSPKAVADGIREMVIRGAPAIGIAVGFGMALGLRNFSHDPMTSIESEIRRLAEQFAATRPTAVNLRWALQRCQGVVNNAQGTLDELVDALFDEAHLIFENDRSNNLELGRKGAALFDAPVQVLTHCNTGGLATGGYGTALGIIRVLHAEKKLNRVWIDETRPYLQGARLTAWECVQDGINGTLITDSMAAHLMQKGVVDAVITGTDRVAANGDVANKIGTYGLAVLCDYHRIPFYVASPLSTIDRETSSGADIPIEERSRAEVTEIGATSIAPDQIDVAHPAFDVTPAELVTAIVTEAGVVTSPDEEKIRRLFDGARAR